MTKRKAPKTWAEEIADLDDPTPRDFDPEELDKEESSDGSSTEDSTRGREHYLSVEKSKLRKSSGPSLGPEYSGSQISRRDLFTRADDSEDDPFASSRSQQDDFNSSAASEQYDDLDVADLNAQADTDEEINSDEAFGDGDDGKFEGYAFRGSRKGRKMGENSKLQTEVNEFEDEDDEEFGGFESDANEMELGINGRNREVNGSHLKKSKTSEASFQNDNMELEDPESASSEETESESRGSDSSSNTSSTSPPAMNERATVRKLMAESQRAVISNLSKAAKSDISKGRAIKQQRATFDSLLNTRIRLQKALVAANSLPDRSTTSKSDTIPAVQAAEEAALRLWSTIDSLRQSLRPMHSPKKSESKSQGPTSRSSLSNLWTCMQHRESQLLPNRNTTLDKWSLKTAPISSLPSTNKFSTTPTQRPLSAILQQQLTSDMDKLVHKTQIPRSCAPVQAAASASSSKQKPINSETTTRPTTTQIYDDADFYALLLRELVDQRMATTSSSSASAGTFLSPVPGIKDRALRVRKNVDTKASKGRKMRYTVHEKLQNFMAPEDRGSWEERAREDLFRGLLGRKSGLEEGSEGDGESDEMGGAEDGLRLFRR